MTDKICKFDVEACDCDVVLEDVVSPNGELMNTADVYEILTRIEDALDGDRWTTDAEIIMNAKKELTKWLKFTHSA